MFIWSTESRRPNDLRPPTDSSIKREYDNMTVTGKMKTDSAIMPVIGENTVCDYTLFVKFDNGDMRGKLLISLYHLRPY